MAAISLCCANSHDTPRPAISASQPIGIVAAGEPLGPELLSSTILPSGIPAKPLLIGEIESKLVGHAQTIHAVTIEPRRATGLEDPASFSYCVEWSSRHGRNLE